MQSSGRRDAILSSVLTGRPTTFELTEDEQSFRKDLANEIASLTPGMIVDIPPEICVDEDVAKGDAWDEDKHPRGEHGKFVASSSDAKEAKVKALHKAGKDVSFLKYKEKKELSAAHGGWEKVPASKQQELHDKYSKVMVDTKAKVAAEHDAKIAQAVYSENLHDKLVASMDVGSGISQGAAAQQEAEQQAAVATVSQPVETPQPASPAASPDDGKSDYAKKLEQMKPHEVQALKIGKNVAAIKYGEKKQIEAKQGSPLTKEQKKDLDEKYNQLKGQKLYEKGLGPKPVGYGEPSKATESLGEKKGWAKDEMDLAAKASVKMPPAEFAAFEKKWQDTFGFKYSVAGKVSGVDKILAASKDKNEFEAKMQGMKSDYHQSLAKAAAEKEAYAAEAGIKNSAIKEMVDQLDKDLMSSTVAAIDDKANEIVGTSKIAQLRATVAAKMANLPSYIRDRLGSIVTGNLHADAEARDRVASFRDAARRDVASPAEVKAYAPMWRAWAGNSTTSEESRMLKAAGEQAFDAYTYNHGGKSGVGVARDNFVKGAASDMASKGLTPEGLARLVHANRIVTEARLRATLPPGTKTITLYRGMRMESWTNIGRKPPAHGVEATVMLNPFSSFTTNETTARSFAGGGPVFKMEIPLSDIVVEHSSTKAFGNYAGEREFVVISQKIGRRGVRI